MQRDTFSSILGSSVPALKSPKLGWSLAVLALVIALACTLSAYFLVRAFEARTQERLQVQQNLEADLWARMLTARMEAHQRLLASIAEGMHSSLLDKPAVLDALMRQDGSMLRLFDSLHVALPSGAVSHHGAVGAVTEINASGAASLRRTMTDGKPSITFLHVFDDIQHLSVLLSVPMRQADGRVTGALAARVKLPVAALLPEVGERQEHVQYALLDSDGTVLVHSQTGQRKLTAQALFGDYLPQWRALSQPSTANADTQRWGDMLASRVGLPLPQWQAVILRDLSAQGRWLQQLPMQVWMPWLLALCLLWLFAGIALRLRRYQAAPAAQSPESDLQPTAAQQHLQGQQEAAAWEAVPSAMLVEHAGHVRILTPQARVLLGYFSADAQSITMHALVPLPQELAAARQALVDLGSFEGLLQLRKKDGGTLKVHVIAWANADGLEGTVWRLQLPWPPQAAMPLPDKEHVWRDSLTGLPNRDAFMWSLQSWVSDSMQAKKEEPNAAGSSAVPMPTHGCVLFADLDHLGLMNETTSREMGNKLLRHVGCLMADHVQPLGQMARLGGDEFAVLLPGVSLAHAQGIAQALCDAVWRWQPHWCGERQWISISIGVVAVDAQRHTPQQALRAADMACYEAKRRGRCQVAVGQISAQAMLQT